jgi:sugar phosphate isomerase/epimerase
MKVSDPMSRRRFVQTSALAATALAAAGRASAAPSKRKIPLSLQLYSIRKDCAKDFDAALAEVAKMGFDGVEFAGYHNYSGKPKELRKRLDDLGLGVAATHIGSGSLKGDKLAKTIDFHKEIGCKFLIVPGDSRFTASDASNKKLADFFNETAAKLKEHGMACGYHNHTHEFAKVGDTNYWELFANRTGKDVILQIDCGWATVAGQDVPDLIKRHPGRIRTTHFKPAVVKSDKGEKIPILGQDSVKWPSIIAACRDYGGTEWITIEQEACPKGKSPMESTRLSLAGLKAML